MDAVTEELSDEEEDDGGDGGDELEKALLEAFAIEDDEESGDDDFATALDAAFNEDLAIGQTPAPEDGSETVPAGTVEVMVELQEPTRHSDPMSLTPLLNLDQAGEQGELYPTTCINKRNIWLIFMHILGSTNSVEVAGSNSPPLSPIDHIAPPAVSPTRVDKRKRHEADSKSPDPVTPSRSKKAKSTHHSPRKSIDGEPFIESESPRLLLEAYCLSVDSECTSFLSSFCILPCPLIISDVYLSFSYSLLGFPRPLWGCSCCGGSHRRANDILACERRRCPLERDDHRSGCSRCYQPDLHGDQRAFFRLLVRPLFGARCAWA